MKICLADKRDARQIAKIHRKEINQGFLSQLGENFLSKLYEAMILSKNAFVVVAKENNQVIGFVSGCPNVKYFYKNFFKKYFFPSLIALLPKLFNVSIFKKILETLKYPSKEKKQKLPEAELLTIATLKEFHGQGTAQKLFERFILEMKNRDVQEFKVVVGENLPRAITFYEKMGFEFHSPVSIHKNQASRVYVYKIK
jgi:ribosomal protein S18 acetylase RimI-like enzyme